MLKPKMAGLVDILLILGNSQIAVEIKLRFGHSIPLRSKSL